MSTATFTVLSHQNKPNGVLYEIFADNVAGFADFVDLHGTKAVPGSTVDIADAKAVFRLRHDGEWEDYESYAASDEEAAAIEEAATEYILDELIPDDFIEDTTTEESEGATE